VLPILNAGLRLRGLRTLGRLAPVERWLLLRAVLLVGAIRVALWVVPFRRVRQFMRACERVPLSVPVDLPVPRLVWAVRSASRRIPMASCLTQSLALQFLLIRTGRSAQLHIGVKKDPQTGFQAHAWVESAGCTLLSTPSEVVGYSPILALEDLSA
jgi:Transglutaminase-like superfamily